MARHNAGVKFRTLQEHESGRLKDAEECDGGRLTLEHCGVSILLHGSGLGTFAGAKADVIYSEPELSKQVLKMTSCLEKRNDVWRQTCALVHVTLTCQNFRYVTVLFYCCYGHTRRYMLTFISVSAITVGQLTVGVCCTRTDCSSSIIHYSGSRVSNIEWRCFAAMLVLGRTNIWSFCNSYAHSQCHIIDDTSNLSTARSLRQMS